MRKVGKQKATRKVGKQKVGNQDVGKQKATRKLGKGVMGGGDVLFIFSHVNAHVFIGIC